MTARERRRLASFATRNGVMLVADEVYHLLDWESGTTTMGDEEDDPSSDARMDESAPSRRPASIARFDAPGPHRRECGTTTTTMGVDRYDDRGWGRIGCCVSVSSFTKIWGPGMRLGWIDAPKIVVRRLRGYGYVRSQGGHGVFAGGMMTRAIESRLLDAFLERLRREYAKRYHLMCNILNEEPRIVLPTRDYPPRLPPNNNAPRYILMYRNNALLLTMRTFVIVKSASAPPCIQSTFAKFRPYAPFVTIPLVSSRGGAAGDYARSRELSANGPKITST
jgi:hypothetical protein